MGINCDASTLPGLPPNPASGSSAPESFARTVQPNPKGTEKEKHCFNFQQLDFHSCGKQLIKFTTSLFAGEFIVKKKNGKVKWRNTGTHVHAHPLPTAQTHGQPLCSEGLFPIQILASSPSFGLHFKQWLRWSSRHPRSWINSVDFH